MNKRVYELARELGMNSKDLLLLMVENNIEVKNHMSFLTDDQIELVRSILIRQDNKEKNSDINESPVVSENIVKKDMVDYSIQTKNDTLEERINNLEKTLQSTLQMLQTLVQSQSSTETRKEQLDIQTQRDIVKSNAFALYEDDDQYDIQEIPLNRVVKVMSLFSGGLNLKTSDTNNAQVVRFEFVGQTLPIIYQDLIKMIGNQRQFFEEGYCMILDKDVVKAHYLEKFYKKFIDGKVINNILEYEPDKIREIFSNVTGVIQQSIVDVVISKILNNEYVDKNKVSVLSEVYGRDIFELANKLR